MNYATPVALKNFFNTLKNQKQTPQFINQLPVFFNNLRNCFDGISIAEKPTIVRIPHIKSLATWFDILREPLEKVRISGVFCDPWQLAKLGTDEVRNSAILAWLLNPKSNHGLGDIFIIALLAEIQRYHSDFPNHYGGQLNVNTENYPENDQTNRVDIELDAENFYIIIEVKINANEGVAQMERYGTIAEKQARSRKWMMIFLTPSGVKAKTAENYDQKVIPFSWRKIALLFRKALSVKALHQENNFSVRLVELYLRHVSNF